MGHKPNHDLSEDGGEAAYTLPTGENFQIRARAPGRKFNLQVFLNGIATQGDARGSSTISLGWDCDGYVNWVLVVAMGGTRLQIPRQIGWRRTSRGREASR